MSTRLVTVSHNIMFSTHLRAINKSCCCSFMCGSVSGGDQAVSARCAAALRRISRLQLPAVTSSLPLDVDGHRVVLRPEKPSSRKLLPLCQKGKRDLAFAFGLPFTKKKTKSGLENVWSVSFLTGLKTLLFRELSTSIKVMQYDLGRTDLAKSSHKKLLFDTHAMVQLMEDNGFTIQQAEVIVKMLVNTTNSNMDIMYSDMVTKTQQEIMLQKVMSHIAAVKKDMIILEKSEFSALLAENERIMVELVQLKIQLADMMSKLRLDNKLDMNSEKSQVKEMKAEHEKKLLETRNDMMEMLAEQNRHVTQNNVKIDTEVAGLKTMLESHKLDSIKYLAGSVFTCLTVVLGFYRIWM